MWKYTDASVQSSASNRSHPSKIQLAKTFLKIASEKL